jgi:spore germination protein YaaH
MLAPGTQHVEPDFQGIAQPVFYRGEMSSFGATGHQDRLKLPLELLQQWVDPHIIYEPESDSVIVTTSNRVLQMRTNQLTALLNAQPFELRFPVEKAEDTVYVPIGPLEQIYGIQIREDESTGVVQLLKAGDVIQWAVVPTDAKKPERTVPLRLEADRRAPIVHDLKQEDRLMIWKEQSGWYFAQAENGLIGFVNKNDVILDGVETVPTQRTEEEPPSWKPLGEKINLTWEAVYTRNPDPAQIPDMPGVHVVSPTWFHLEDGEGRLSNKADLAYVKWAHSRGLQVWALFSNNFDPDLTTAALSTYERRLNMIKQLLAFAQMYQLQGINIDFENVYTKDKDKLTQFVREMTPLMHEQGLTVSIDVTPISNSEMWSVFYDRKALAEAVDYMIVMAYDEHWAASPIAGSVSSLPWAERSVRRIIEEEAVPPAKLILGIPYYTRLWTETAEGGETKVSSKTFSMDAAQQWISERKLKPVFDPATGQNYAEYKEKDGVLHRIWLEDETSIKARVQLVHKYGLAGVATWRRGFESEHIWSVLNEALLARQ